MKRFVLAVVVLLSFGQASASERYDDIELYQLKKEVRMLRDDIQRLEVLILRSSKKTDKDDVIADTKSGAWGCYIKDLRAGGVYGTGQTEAEAKGKTLEKCEQKGGVCWESNLKCSSDKS
ncbi:hypothetical protein HWV00_15160 [Moritella sp. 24]|uniref:hypothetical protein n=1 Tax=Moritella sp. 24 TaxID=2746230 RepID=UPI001BAA38E2|nr:hypothetical protein [Moritella sp. 24]QUM77449.1 hypothetical protein HWV00_15160 [Moritella sp. 24]